MDMYSIPSTEGVKLLLVAYAKETRIKSSCLNLYRYERGLKYNLFVCMCPGP